MWAQLLLVFSTNHFETMHICSTWSEDVRVVLVRSYLSYGFKSHKALLTKPGRRGALARNGLLSSRSEAGMRDILQLLLPINKQGIECTG